MPSSRAHVRFGTFQLDLRAAELHKNGIRIRLQQQPAQLLAILLEHPGQIVTREELRQCLWSEDTFVDFEHGLNAAVKRLREALGDSAENPVFIETLPRRGYRFIAPVESGGKDFQPAAVTAAASASVADRHEVVSGRKLAVVTIAFLLVIAGLLGYIRWKSHRASTAIVIRSLAVLPLQDMSNYAQTEYFSDGMTEALITELGKIRALRVISHHSVMKYKHATKPVPEVAKELNVDGVVEGGVLLNGQQVRITVQLIAANPEQHLWAESYERDLRDVISLQREVARDIAGQIKITTLTLAEQSPLLSGRPVKVEAYDAYLQGRYLFGWLSEDKVAKAIAYYEQAVELDPTYAPAWASLAEAREFQAGAYGTPQDCEKARQAAERAVALDPKLAQAHAAMGTIKMYCDWNWSGADASFQQALTLEPRNAQTLQDAASLAATLGRFEQALVWNRRAIESNPLDSSAWHILGLNAAYGGRLDEAAAAIAKALELNPQHPWSHAVLGSIYLAKSRPQEALVEMERETHPVFRVQGMAIAYHALSRKKESDAALAELIAKWQRQAAFQIAEVYAFRGEAEQAFRWLEKAYSQRDSGLPYLKGDPMLRSLERDRRYAAFLRRMNLPQ